MGARQATEHGGVGTIVEQARDRVRATGARVTGARVKVLAALLEAGGALAHVDVQRRLEHSPAPELLDRVTLYRVLEWLVEAGLAHRVSGPDRVWRFSAQGAPHDPHGQHGHFKCRRCGRMFCMKASTTLARTVRAMLPDGFAGDEVELTVLGACADCAPLDAAEAEAEAAAGDAPQGRRGARARGDDRSRGDGHGHAGHLDHADPPGH